MSVPSIGVVAWVILLAFFWLLRTLVSAALDGEIARPGRTDRHIISNISCLNAHYVSVHVIWALTLPIAAATIKTQIPVPWLGLVDGIVPEHFLLCVASMSLVALGTIWVMIWRPFVRPAIKRLFDRNG